jgi:putative Mg2+ transporter-C (MgtC) family protein
MPETWELLLRLLAATALGGVIGAERELSDQPAGFRTHALVALGAALFTVVSAFGFDAIVTLGPPTVMRADVTRVVSQIVVGIGFLGGGAILKYGASVRGLTTAATLWITAAIGTAVGLGAWVMALGATVLTLLALSAFRPVRRLLERFAATSGELRVETKHDTRVPDVLRLLETVGISAKMLEVDDHDGARRIRVRVKLPAGSSSAELAQQLLTDPRFSTVDWIEE